jgi:hypothetical protein
MLDTGEREATHGIVPCTHHTAITRDRHTSDADIILGNQLVRALILAQIPDANIPSTITTNQLPLIRMDDHIIDRNTVRVVPLHVAAARIPDLDGAVFGRSHQPLGLAVERYAGDVARVAVEREDGIGVCGFDVVELDGVVAGSREVAFVGRDAETVYLGIGMGDGAGADARKSLPEAIIWI